MRLSEILAETVDTALPAFQQWFAGSWVATSLGTPLLCYHGSGRGVIERHFQPLTHFGTLKAAHAILRHNAERGHYWDEDHIFPVYLRITNPVEIKDRRGVRHGVMDFANWLAFGDYKPYWTNPEKRNARYGIIPLETYRGIETAADKTTALVTAMRQHGYDGFTYGNAVEDRGSISWVILSSAQVWPALSDSPDTAV
jgi:hypothetical protein